MGRDIKARLQRLERQAGPPVKTVVWWAGKGEPRPVVDKHTIILKVVYEDRRQWD